jgi:hypothetical protein
MEFLWDNGMRKALQPLYSTDLMSFDLYLFGHGKVYLSGCSFIDADQLRRAIPALLEGIDKATVHMALLEWMERLRKYIKVNGDYTR